jgi:hypothetical protein
MTGRRAIGGEVGPAHRTTVYREDRPNPPPVHRMPDDLWERIDGRNTVALALEAHRRSGGDVTRFHRITVETDRRQETTMKTIREAVEAELKRQYEASGPYGQLHYLSLGEDGIVQLEGGVDLEEMATAIHKRLLGEQYVALVGYDPFVGDPTQTVEQVEELIAGVRAEAGVAQALQLAEAEGIIRDLCDHEGAEGWSKDLNDRLDRYQFTTEKGD